MGIYMANTIKTATKTELLREAILRTADLNGVVTASGVFQAAKNPNSILHKEFIWDGDEAIKSLGLQRAAELIRSVRVEVIVDTHKIVAPFYVNDPRDTKPGEYVPVNFIKQDETLKHGVLINEMSRIEGAINRARAIAGVLDIESEFSAMLDSVEAIRSRLKEAA